MIIGKILRGKPDDKKKKEKRTEFLTKTPVTRNQWKPWQSSGGKRPPDSWGK